MDSDSNDYIRLSNAELAAELARLGFTWVAASRADSPQPPPAQETLLAALAASKEARLRLALIPLGLARSDHAQSTIKAAGLVSGQARVTLICYYTAAALLREKYARQLARLGLDHEPLPDLFGGELGLPQSGDPDVKLRTLAERQAVLSGRRLNWYGTYEHAAERFLKRSELELSWVTN